MERGFFLRGGGTPARNNTGAFLTQAAGSDPENGDVRKPATPNAVGLELRPPPLPFGPPQNKKPRDVRRPRVCLRRPDSVDLFEVTASFYDAKRVERCFFSRRGGHRPEEEWAFYWQKKPPFSGPRWGPRKGDAKKPATANAVSIKRDDGRLPLRANPIQEHPPTTALREREREKTLGILESIFQTGSGDDDTLG